MINSKDILASLPVLADVLGRKFGVKISFNGDTAWTDGAHINLPALPLDADKNLLLLIRGYIDHEAAHVRETDFPLLQASSLTALEHHISNILEDWRVEKKLSEIFPGSRHNFAWLNRHLFLENNHHTDSKADTAITVLFTWMLLAVYSWTVPELEPRRDSAAQEMEAAFPGLHGRIDAFIQRLPEYCRSTYDAIEAARAIAALLKEYAYEDKEPQQQPDDEAGTADGRGGEEDGSTESASCSAMEGQATGEGSGDAEKAAQAQRDSQDGEKRQPQDEENGGNKQSPSVSEVEGGWGNRGKHEGLEALRESLSAKNLAKATVREALQRQLERKSAKGSVSTAVETTAPLHPLSPEDIRKTKKTTAALTAKLRALLQSKQLVRSFPGRHGRIQPQLLHRMFIGNASLFLQRTEKTRISAAVHILLDASSSMHGEPITLACNATYALAKSLHSLSGISVGVTAFPGEDPYENKPLASVVSVLQHGESLHRRFALEASGGTPMAESLWAVLPILQQRKEGRKILLLVTDGGANNVASAQAAVAALQKSRVEVYGIGIKSKGVEEILPETSLVIHSIQELAPAMFTALLRAFTAAA